MNKADYINKNAAIEMAEKIVEEIDTLDCDIEAKKSWARALMESVVPASNIETEMIQG